MIYHGALNRFNLFLNNQLCMLYIKQHQKDKSPTQMNFHASKKTNRRQGAIFCRQHYMSNVNTNVQSTRLM